MHSFTIIKKNGANKVEKNVTILDWTFKEYQILFVIIITYF